MYALTKEDRSKGGKAAQVARQEQRHVEMRRATRLTELVAVYEHLDLAEAFEVATFELMAQALGGELPPAKTPLDVLRYMQAADIGMKGTRLLRGESTSNIAHANINPADIEERVAALRADTIDTPPT